MTSYRASIGRIAAVVVLGLGIAACGASSGTAATDTPSAALPTAASAQPTPSHAAVPLNDEDFLNVARISYATKPDGSLIGCTAATLSNSPQSSDGWPNCPFSDAFKARLNTLVSSDNQPDSGGGQLLLCRCKSLGSNANYEVTAHSGGGGTVSISTLNASSQRMTSYLLTVIDAGGTAQVDDIIVVKGACQESIADQSTKC